MSRIKKIVFAALAAAAFTGAARAVHLAGTGEQQCERRHPEQQRRERGRSSDEQRTQSERLCRARRGRCAQRGGGGARTRDRAQLFAYTPVGCVIQFGAQRERCELSPGGGEHRLRPEKRIRGRECVDEFAGPPREHSEQQLLAHRLCERQYRRHALLGAAFRGLTGADRHSLPAALNARPRADCINRSDSAICTDFFRHRAGDFLPPYRSTLPLKVQPVQALAEQVSIF